MKREDVIRLAREADPFGEAGRFYSVAMLTPETLERFAALVAAAEREECAKVCDDLDDYIPDGLAGWQFGEAIRARGKK
ncbi:MAG: hypothetical protein RL563_2669 [Pseudomonadota bacterium]